LYNIVNGVTLRYVRHNDDVIPSGVRFLLFSWRKRGTVHKTLLEFRGNSYSYRNRIIVNGCYWNTCKLVFIITHTHGYTDSYSYQCVRGLTRSGHVSI